MSFSLKKTYRKGQRRRRRRIERKVVIINRNGATYKRNLEENFGTMIVHSEHASCRKNYEEHARVCEHPIGRRNRSRSLFMRMDAGSFQTTRCPLFFSNISTRLIFSYQNVYLFRERMFRLFSGINFFPYSNSNLRMMNGTVKTLLDTMK